MTYRPRSEFLEIMVARGFYNDCTDMQGLDEAMLAGVVPGYIGFDATAASLHVGSLIQIMMLRWLQKTGHRPIVLMGGGTSKVGDPSFRADERALLTGDQIAANIAGIKRVFTSYVTFGDGGTDALMLDNSEWLDGLNYLEFLRDIGRHFSVNRMLGFDSVKSRLDRDQSLSFLEFNYMILQAYDFLELNRRHGCVLQMGGSDQWGNIVNGIDLTRRVAGTEVFGVTSPLLTTADGKKMGKSADGAVWLNADMRSPYEFWQFWRNTADADVGRFLKLYTEMPILECDRLGALGGAEINEAKILLANAVTTLAHGTEAATTAAATAFEVFEKGGLGDDLPSISLKVDDFDWIGTSSYVHGMTTQERIAFQLGLDTSNLGNYHVSATTLFVRAGLVGSGKEAKRLIAEGGARINDEVVQKVGAMVSAAEVANTVKLSAGRKRHALVKLDA